MQAYENFRLKHFPHFVIILLIVTKPKHKISELKITNLRSLVKQSRLNSAFNLLKPTGYVMHQHFKIEQLYVLPTLYLRVLYLSENKQRLVLLTS